MEKADRDDWWPRWVWVGECFFWYRLTRVVPDKIHRAVKWLCVLCVCILVHEMVIHKMAHESSSKLPFNTYQSPTCIRHPVQLSSCAEQVPASHEPRPDATLPPLCSVVLSEPSTPLHSVLIRRPGPQPDPAQPYTQTQPFYCSSGICPEYVQDYPGEQVPERYKPGR